jgi:SAM-dependent methyltransferase
LDPKQIRWIDDQRLMVGDEPFFVLDYAVATDVVVPPDDSIVIWKPRWSVEVLIERAPSLVGARIVELGIFQGGSVALMARLADPEKLVAIDLIPAHDSRLDDYIARSGLEQVIRPYWELDQGDRAAVRAAVEREFGDDDLDLVLDDASHEYAPTRTSFEVLFPRLRPGGRYLIEDWNGAELGLGILRTRSDPDQPTPPEVQLFPAALTQALHDPDHYRHAMAAELAHLGMREAFAVGDRGEVPDDDEMARLATVAERPVPGYRPLSHLVLQLVMAATTGDVITEVVVGPLWVEVVRGPAALDRDSFALDDHVPDHFGLFEERRQATAPDQPRR